MQMLLCLFTNVLNICVVCTTSTDDQSYEEERRLRAELELRSQRLTLELADTKQHIQEGDYRRDNYPNIRRWFFCLMATLQ